MLSQQIFATTLIYVVPKIQLNNYPSKMRYNMEHGVKWKFKKPLLWPSIKHYVNTMACYHKIASPLFG